MATLEEDYKQYQNQTNNTQQINQMYDAQKNAQLASLESAYNQNMSNAQAARDALPAQYQGRANDLAVQYERQRRNLNQQAAANGLNTGAGSQMQLALGSNYNRDYGNLRTAQQQAINDADRGIRDLQSAYQSSVQQAVANNDYQRAQALLSEYQNQYKQQLQQAQTLASYGDFSAYLNIPGYSQQQVDNMRNAWIASNPQLAYNTGALSAEDYYRMTGQWPAGYQNPNAGSGWSYTSQTPPDEVLSGAGVDKFGNSVSDKSADYTSAMNDAINGLRGNVNNALPGFMGNWSGNGSNNGAGNSNSIWSQFANAAESTYQGGKPVANNAAVNGIAASMVNNPANAKAIFQNFIDSPYYSQATPAQIEALKAAYYKSQNP